VKQFLLTEEPDRDGLVRLRGEDYHYLVHVRRLKPGGAFTALLPSSAGERNSTPDSGQLVTITVTDIDGHTLTGTTAPYNPSEREQKGEALAQAASPAYSLQIPPIILFQAMPKEPKMDLIVRQAAESGISEVVPFIAEHSIAKQHYRTERWERIIKEARQQSGSAVDTKIREPLSDAELFAYWAELHSEKTLGIIFSPDQPLEKGGFHRYLNKEPSSVVLAVGPEGGFSPGELDRFLEAGFKPLCMGPAVLRTETAALYGAAAVRIILLEKKWWALEDPKKLKPMRNQRERLKTL